MHHVRAVANLQRIAVQSATSAPSACLRLTIDPGKNDILFLA
jgi:hypothetical protein